MDDLTEYERPILSADLDDGSSLATDDSGFKRIRSPLTGVGLFTSNVDPAVVGYDPLTGEDAMVGTDVGFGAPMRRALSSNVYNGGFEEPPPDTELPISAGNPLPGWRWIHESGTAFVPYWVSVGAGLLNGQINVTMVAGAAGDRSYFEQLVPVIPSVGTLLWYYRVIPYVGGDVTSVDSYVEAQFIDAEGTEVGAAGTSSALGLTSSPVYPDTDGSTPGTATWLRVRVGWQRNSGAADSATGTGLLSEVAVNGSNGYQLRDFVPPTNWTPVLTCATPGDLSVAYTRQLGRYTKVDRMVHWHLSILTSTWTHTTASGAVSVTGLPYTAATIANWSWAGNANVNYTKAGYSHVIASVASAATSLSFRASGSGSAIAVFNVADLPTGTQVNMFASGSYEAST